MGQSHINVGIEFTRYYNKLDNFQKWNLPTFFFCRNVSHEYDCKRNARLSLSLSAVRHSSLECRE